MLAAVDVEVIVAHGCGGGMAMRWGFQDVAAVPAGLPCELEITADSGSPYGVMSRVLVG